MCIKNQQFHIFFPSSFISSGIYVEILPAFIQKYSKTVTCKYLVKYVATSNVDSDCEWINLYHFKWCLLSCRFVFGVSVVSFCSTSSNVCVCVLIVETMNEMKKCLVVNTFQKHFRVLWEKSPIGTWNIFNYIFFL